MPKIIVDLALELSIQFDEVIQVVNDEDGHYRVVLEKCRKDESVVASFYGGEYIY